MGSVTSAEALLSGLDAEGILQQQQLGMANRGIHVVRYGSTYPIPDCPSPTGT